MDSLVEAGADVAGVPRPTGTNSTFRLNGVLVGSDKPDHFWDLGYAYARRSGWGEHPERGIELSMLCRGAPG
jgi:hypothetical protein